MSATPADYPTEQLERVGVTYADLIEMNESALEEALFKIEEGRVRDESKEQVRQGWHRVANKHLRELRQALEAYEEAREVDKRLDALEERL